jgi:hypothetical protein
MWTHSFSRFTTHFLCTNTDSPIATHTHTRMSKHTHTFYQTPTSYVHPKTGPHVHLTCTHVHTFLVILTHVFISWKHTCFCFILALISSYFSILHTSIKYNTHLSLFHTFQLTHTYTFRSITTHWFCFITAHIHTFRSITAHTHHLLLFLNLLYIHIYIHIQQNIPITLPPKHLSIYTYHVIFFCFWKLTGFLLGWSKCCTYSFSAAVNQIW